MSPITLYGSPALEAAREYPFATLTGCPVEVWAAEDMYRSNPEWAALWPLVRRRADCAVFLDRHGWVARGVRVEAEGLLAQGKRVWWFNSGEPTERFGFGPANRADWQFRYCRVGLGYRRPVRRTRDSPLEALRRPPDDSRAEHRVPGGDTRQSAPGGRRRGFGYGGVHRGPGGD